MRQSDAIALSTEDHWLVLKSDGEDGLNDVYMTWCNSSRRVISYIEREIGYPVTIDMKHCSHRNNWVPCKN
jgi:hypothetical protein